MKTRILLVLFALLFASEEVRGQHTSAVDTLVLCRPDTVVIVHSDSLLAVTVNGRSGDPDFIYENRLTVADTSAVMTTASVSAPEALRMGAEGGFFDFGAVEGKHTGCVSLRFPVALEVGLSVPFSRPEGMRTMFFRTYELGIDLLSFDFTPRRGNWWMTLAFALSLHKYEMRKHAFTADADHVLSVGPMPADAHDARSAMFTFGEDIKVLCHHSIGRRSSVAAGVMLTCCTPRFGNVCSTVWEDADGKQHSETHRITPRRVVPSFRVECLPVRFMKFYLNIAPWSPFKSGKGLQYGTLSFGIGMGF